MNEKLNTLVPNAETAPEKLHEAIRWSLLAGGKRFRPALVFAVGKVFGADAEKLLTAAAAIEMIHTYSLIHDDLPAMDDDDLRRGRATCHKKFGEATAILAGDVLQTLAFQAVSDDKNLSAEIRLELISGLARAAGTPFGMVAGQQLDLEAAGKNISARELETIHQSKTGALICAAARSGAIIAGARKTELETITDYAKHLGLLFQITDDLLDATQTTEVLGKTAGKDKAADKATYISLYGAAQAKKLAQETHDKACLVLDKIDRDAELLRGLIDFILKRQF
ncbi:MAG: polyprenyl synthetase family protein [Pyrinomonadaceae bacterium]